MDGRERGGISRTRAGEQRTVILLHATRPRKRKRGGEEKKLPMPNQWQDEVISLPLGFLSAAWKTSPWKATSTHPGSRAEHSSSNKSADPRVQPASASCSWGAVTSQIPASLFIPFCSSSKTPAVFTPALAGPAPGTRDGPAGEGWRRRRRRWVTAAARPPRGQCRPGAALPRPPRDRCRPPRSVAECYPVLNVTLTHSIPDTTALTSSIHAARAAIGRASRPGGAVLPLRPFITPGHRQRRRRGAGGAGGAGTPGRLGRAPAGGARGCPERVRGPSARRDPDPGLGLTTCSRRAGKPAPPRGACGRTEAGEPGTGGRFPGPLLRLPRSSSRIPTPRLLAGNASLSGRRGVFGFLEKDARKVEQWGEPLGCRRKKKKDFIESDR